TRRDGTADIAVADDADGLALDFVNVELFPPAGHLIAYHAAEILREVKNCGERELAQRLAEHAGAVGGWHGAVNKFGQEEIVGLGGTRMDPTHTRRHGEDLA